ncbi:Probable type I restriction enzyme BthVORF4518P M protein [Burkholderia pseudomallei]|uniref:Eco57I restriction-modification methylase domain-containing protein n=1 Tax=Burkholderia pseudomallei TaxID=28450 RepID=UPI00293A4DEE|nr:Probable type I restriction enzyme BthVORF4518P M protein [Burkholderia pseudomallei]CAJ2883741.1 Probable type I restriction enzyme BthVORF4518P M protein [Burkholderia pseudomallei]CAJ4233193.1 Probable type I restriction enzyme BthVORF4518P M protein [Burkholderia pseudomallei]CAJ9461221.1 Probable type I restriction enzyme BthVORF4518P M protein [Burkholderia pseudomallei]CAK0062312.1 Probable type I restriction enzyme BthVORF4518P M protein [Burkholderia pseudomallei]
MARLNSTRKTHQLTYRAIRIEGGLIPADELTRLTVLADPKDTEQTESHYRIAKGLKLRDEIARDFKIALNLWQDFQVLRQRQDVRLHEVTVREWLIPLLRDVLHFHDIGRHSPIEVAGHQYNIGHAGSGGRVPLVLAGVDEPLDTAADRFGETNPETGKIRRRSPFMLTQEALNASDDSLWALVSNGLSLRILRDNPSLTRPAYIEVDLEAIFAEELLADFSAFWLLAHASRFGNAEALPTDCPWERWRDAGQQVGVTVRGKLRNQVANALRALGTGFLSHPANHSLRAALQDAESGYDRQAFFEELLRLVYRLIFLSTVEDRRDRGSGERLVFAPDASDEAEARYLDGYSLTWLRERAVRRSQHDRHADLWQALTITFRALAHGEAALGLPAIGGLFDADQCSHLDAGELENRHLLAAVFELGWFRADGSLSRVNYRDMGPEELGSVYESLLELVPDLQGLTHAGTARLAFVGDEVTEASSKGNTRKLTGSYYTPDSLVQELIKSALEPVIEQTVKTNPQRPVEALLELTVCDPACGSGHFLLSAARRLADEVALHRAAAEREGGAPTPADYRHALRDVVSRCIYGVDKNPMAIQLAKTALWLEAYSPDRPLSFVDHHLRVGDALLGVLDPKVLEHGIPDEAYTVLSGDDKATASALKKQNKADLKSWRAIAGGDLLTQAGLAAQAVTVEALDDDTPEHLAAKRQAWSAAEAEAQRSTFARLADTYVAAFLAPKLADTKNTVPLSGYLWSVFSGQPATAELEDAAQALCRQHTVFHWWLAFPQVATRGGFSVMLGNPPWERIKLQEEEFFATRSPLVATARNKAERSQRIEWLREGVLLHNVNPDLERAEGLAPPNRAEMSLYASFIAARHGAEAASLYVHDGRRYPLTGVGDVNTYALFAETFLQATAPTGRAGFIVPTGIATDDSTKAYFEAVSQHRRLVALYSFENEEFVFPAVHHAMKFALLVTTGESGTNTAAQLVYFARQVDYLYDSRRRFTLTPDEFGLINPNTRTCPVFRSERDAELTKKLYLAAPVLIKEAVTDEVGKVLQAEENPWGISFQRMFDMATDSNLFRDKPSLPDESPRLPLYEAKMIHQFDHRWATYVDSPGGKIGEVETADVTSTQKIDSAFTVRPRYWVSECEVLARIANVPTKVARTWLELKAVRDAAQRDGEDAALADLLRALAQWVAGELFHVAAGSPTTENGWTPTQAQSHIETVGVQLQARFPRLGDMLRGEGLTTKKALSEFPKWANQNVNARLSDDELSALAEVLHLATMERALLQLLDGWMDHRSPRWLMGWRDITSATNERTVIASIVPRLGTGDTLLLMYPDLRHGPRLACLLADQCSLVHDFVARQKVGGTHLKYHVKKQLVNLPPERYTTESLSFIVPRVLELSYTMHDLRPWADDLAAYDPRPVHERRQPFTWNPERRAQLRAELDAYYAHLYGLTRDELRYILDPTDVMGADYPSRTFHALKMNEMREFREYRTQRLVLEAWDRQRAMPMQHEPADSVVPVQYSEQGFIRNVEEAKLAGLIVALSEIRPAGCSVSEFQSLIARSALAARYLEPAEVQQLTSLLDANGTSNLVQLIDRVLPIVQRLEAVSVLVREQQGAASLYKRGGGAIPGDVTQLSEHTDIARLLVAAESRRVALEGTTTDDSSATRRSTGTR